MLCFEEFWCVSHRKVQTKPLQPLRHLLGSCLDQVVVISNGFQLDPRSPFRVGIHFRVNQYSDQPNSTRSAIA
jgi:hypothetical protein